MQAKIDDDFHGGQRSSEVKCGKVHVCAMAYWLPYLVKRTADAS